MFPPPSPPRLPPPSPWLAPRPPCSSLLSSVVPPPWLAPLAPLLAPLLALVLAWLPPLFLGLLLLSLPLVPPALVCRRSMCSARLASQFSSVQLVLWATAKAIRPEQRVARRAPP